MSKYGDWKVGAMTDGEYRMEMKWEMLMPDTSHCSECDRDDCDDCRYIHDED